MLELRITGISAKDWLGKLTRGSTLSRLSGNAVRGVWFGSGSAQIERIKALAGRRKVCHFDDVTYRNRGVSSISPFSTKHV